MNAINTNVASLYTINNTRVNKSSSSANANLPRLETDAATTSQEAILTISAEATAAAANRNLEDDWRLGHFLNVVINDSDRSSNRSSESNQNQSLREQMSASRTSTSWWSEEYLAEFKRRGMLDADGNTTDAWYIRDNWKWEAGFSLSNRFDSNRHVSDHQRDMAEALGMTEDQRSQMASHIINRLNELVQAVTGGIVDFDTMRGIEEQILGEMREMLSQFHEANQLSQV